MHSANIPTGDPFFIVIEMSQTRHSASDQRSGGDSQDGLTDHLSAPILLSDSAAEAGGTRYHFGNVARSRPRDLPETVGGRPVWETFLANIANPAASQTLSSSDEEHLQTR